MVLKKGKTGDREILDKLLQLSKESSLGADYYVLLGSLEARMNQQQLENEALREDVVSDSEYIGLLQKELNEFKQKEKNLPEAEEEIGQLSKEADESKFHAKQLEKGIQYLRCKLEEAKTDKELLNEEILQLREETETLRLQLAQIYPKESSKDGQDGRLDALSTVREHYPGNKARAARSEYSLTDTLDLPKVCEKSELEDGGKRENQIRYQKLDLLPEEVERKLSYAKVYESEKNRLEERCKELEKNLKEVFHNGEEAAKHRMELELKIRCLEEEKRVLEKNLQTSVFDKKNLEEQLTLLGQKVRENGEETKTG